MNHIPSRAQVESLRQRYPEGTRIVLRRMNDPYAPVPPGTKGTVTYVDDMGQIGVNWDNGSRLSLVPGEDSFSMEAELKKAKSSRGMDR